MPPESSSSFLRNELSSHLGSSEKYLFLNLPHLPARVNAEQAAWLLGFSTHDIPVLVAKGFLKPLGDPPPNGTRYFASIELETLRLDPKWLDRASAFLIKHWKTKNQRKSFCA